MAIAVACWGREGAASRCAPGAAAIRCEAMCKCRWPGRPLSSLKAAARRTRDHAAGEDPRRLDCRPRVIRCNSARNLLRSTWLTSGRPSSQHGGCWCPAGGFSTPNRSWSTFQTSLSVWRPSWSRTVVRAERVGRCSRHEPPLGERTQTRAVELLELALVCRVVAL